MKHPVPTCRHCHDVYNALKRIGEDCQTRCLNEMKGRFKELGAFEGRYRDRPPG